MEGTYDFSHDSALRLKVSALVVQPLELLELLEPLRVSIAEQTPQAETLGP